jgi:V/A-type H+-transporting ATPase subunit A
MKDGSIGSITIGGTVSPAGGNFEEPVTQATLKAVGAFHALSRERSDARRYPAIDPLESWSKYTGVIEKDAGTKMIRLLNRAYEVSQMMKVVGEEGTPMDDFVLYLKGEFFDSVYLQQNAFDPIDGATSRERQLNCFGIMENIINTRVTFKNKDEARSVFSRLRSLFIEYNASRWESDEMKTYASQITNYLNEYCQENRADGFMLHDKPFMENHLDSTFVRAKNFKNLNDGIPVHREEDAEDIQ